MKKRVWLISLSIVILVAACGVFIVKQKPSETDFASWMENTYAIQCLDYNCDTFQIDATEGKEPILMQNVHGGYSAGIFVMKVDKTYRNFDDSSYYLVIDVKGYLGKFTIEDETIKNIPKN
jgi:CDP-diacylglycerol pyrophosphatase